MLEELLFIKVQTTESRPQTHSGGCNRLQSECFCLNMHTAACVEIRPTTAIWPFDGFAELNLGLAPCRQTCLAPASSVQGQVCLKANKPCYEDDAGSRDGSMLLLWMFISSHSHKSHRDGMAGCLVSQGAPTQTLNPKHESSYISCCRLRDEALPPLGVQLTDRAGTDQGSDWVLECPSVLRQEAEAKEREAALQRSQKTWVPFRVQGLSFRILG